MTFICLDRLWFLVLNNIHLLLFLQVDVSAKWMWSDPTFPLCYTNPVYSILHMRSTWNFVQNPHFILVSWWFCNENPQIFKNCFFKGTVTEPHFPWSDNHDLHYLHRIVRELHVSCGDVEAGAIWSDIFAPNSNFRAINMSLSPSVSSSSPHRSPATAHRTLAPPLVVLSPARKSFTASTFSLPGSRRSRNIYVRRRRRRPLLPS